MKQLAKKNNFVYLTAGLVLLLQSGALVDNYPGSPGPKLVQAATVMMLMLGVWGFRRDRSLLRTGAVFVATAALLVLAGITLGKVGLRYPHLLVLLCFFIWTAWVAARQVLFTGEIDSNKIVGAICIYMLIGCLWALCYLFTAEISPHAFNGLQQASWHENFFTALYFSFVTLTTLGYGDISPTLPVARFFVLMEAIVGVFYMSVLVASLVGVRMSTHASRDR